MLRLLLIVVSLMTTMLAQPFRASAQSAPVLLYTDLLSGPNSGGENNKGTYLSIFGKHFGNASGLGTVTRVFIGGAEVSEYRYLGPSKGRPDIQQIIVQVGALNNPAPGVALPIDVEVGGVKSKSFAPIEFTVNPGKILFVSLAGDDTTARAGEILHPWRHVQTPESTVAKSTGAWGAAQPGDIIVMRAGAWKDVGFGDAGRTYFAKFYGNSGTQPRGSTGSGPISFTAYPTEHVVIQPPVTEVYGVFDGINSTKFLDVHGAPKYSQWITISNLTISTGGINDGPINLETGSNHWRVVNNDLSAPDAITNRAAGVTGNGTGVEVLGNRIHDVAGTGSRGETLLDHGIYIDSGSHWELAYNLIENITGGNGIQLYNSGHVTPTIDHINIHHNWIHDVNKHGLNIGDTSGVGILIWSNVVYNTRAACWRNNSINLQDARIWNNTFYNCNTDSAYPESAAIMNDVKNTATPITIDFRNNIIWPAHSSGRYAGGEAGFNAAGVRFTGSKNLWYGGNDSESAAPGSENLLANPRFANLEGKPPNFHLQSASPALLSGDVASLSLVISNYDLDPISLAATAINRGAF